MTNLDPTPTETTFTETASTRYSDTLEKFKLRLSQNPGASLREFCHEVHVNYEHYCPTTDYSIVQNKHLGYELYTKDQIDRFIHDCREKLNELKKDPDNIWFELDYKRYSKYNRSICMIYLGVKEYLLYTQFLLNCNRKIEYWIFDY